MLGRASAPGGFGCLRQFSIRLSDWAIAPITVGVISDSMFRILNPRSGHGPKGCSSVTTTQAGRFCVLPAVSEGRFGTGTALCVAVDATSGGLKLKRERVSSRV